MTMKKTLFVFAAIAALGLIVVACSGVSPLAPVAGGAEEECPDFSGEYCVEVAAVYTQTGTCISDAYSEWTYYLPYTFTSNGDGTYQYYTCDCDIKGITIDCNGVGTVTDSDPGSWCFNYEWTETWTFNLLAAIVATTGFAYFWMKYFVESADPFAVVNHPWEATMMHLHVLASPLFLLIFGIILNSHILRKLGAAKMPNRKSGLASFGLFAVMVGSGYLLQVSTDAGWLRALVAVHVGSGAAFSATYVIHLVISARLARRRPATSSIREVA